MKKMIHKRISRFLAFLLIFSMGTSPSVTGTVYAEVPEEIMTPEAEEYPEAADEPAAEAVSESEEIEGVGNPPTHHIQFLNKDGSGVLSGYDYYIEEGRTIAASGNRPGTPNINDEVDGQRFKGWYAESNPSQIFDFSTPIYADYIFHQRWVNLYTVTFHTNKAGVTVPSQTVENGSTADYVSVSADGFAFKHWCSDSTLETEFSFSTPITVDTPLYAKWNPMYTVIFEHNDGNLKNPSLREQTVESGNKVEDPGAQREGFNFTGWYTDSVAGDLWDPDTPVKKNLKVYAHWEVQPRTVSFDSTAYGGTVQTVNLNYGERLTEPSHPDRDGFSFDGWYQLTGTQGQLGAKWNFADGVRENMILVPVYNVIYYTVAYNRGSQQTAKNIPANSTVSCGGSIDAPGKTPYVDENRFYFTYWYLDEACTVSCNFPITVDKAFLDQYCDANDKITLYAGWKRTTYTVTFKIGTETVSEQVIPSRERAHDPSGEPGVKKDGYLIDGWFTDTQLKKPYDFSTVVTESFPLYSEYKDAHTVSFDADGGTPVPELTVISGQIIPKKKVGTTTKEGYTFLCWKVETDPGVYVEWNFDTDRLNTDITLKAFWDRNQYDVFFMNEGKKVSTQKVYFDDPVQDPHLSLIKDGYDFAGWYKDENMASAWDFENDRIGASNLTLYAGWNIKKYRISFNSMSADVAVTPPFVEISYNYLLPQPSATREGYDLDGWYRNQTFSSSARWDFAKDRVQGDGWLYANWRVKKLSVTFISNGGSSVAAQSVKYKGCAVRPPEPTKVGYRFVTWCSDEGLSVSYNFAAPVTSDLKLYAKWKDAPSYTIKAFASDSNGTIMPNGVLTLKEGAAQTFTFSPKDGYEPDVLKVDGKETEFTGNKYLLSSVSCDHTIAISFRKIIEIRHIISANSADSHGMISPSGKVSVKDGDSKTFVFEALDGYQLDYVEVDGIQVALTGNSYTFTNVKKGHTITAHFKEKKIEPIIPVGYVKVVFMLDGTEYQSVVIKEGQTLTVPKEPEKEKSVFMGWYAGSRKWDFMDPVTEDLTLTAKFLSETVSDGDVHSGLDDVINISDPNDITLVKGQTYQFGKGNWSSSDSGILSVGKSSGNVKAKNPSNIPVTLINSDTLPSTVYRIRVIAPEISPKKLTMGVGTTEKLQLLYADGMNVAWRSSNPKVVSVEEGHISSKSTGTAKISAYVNGKAYTCTVTVKDTYTAPANFDDVTAFTLRPAQTLNLKKISVGGVKPNQLDWRLFDESNTRRVNKSGWISWEDDVLKINVNGVLTAKSCGTTTIIGRRGDSRIKIIDVTVGTIPKKSETYLNVGKNEKLTYYKVVNSKAAWDATNLGTVVKLGMENTTKGRVYGLDVGRSTVTCSYNGMTYSTLVHVENPVLSLEDSRLARTGENQYMMFIRSRTRCRLEMPDVEQEIAWKTGNKKIAFVDESGIVEGRKAGVTTVSTKINGTTVKVKVYVTE